MPAPAIPLQARVFLWQSTSRQNKHTATGGPLPALRVAAAPKCRATDIAQRGTVAVLPQQGVLQAQCPRDRPQSRCTKKNSAHTKKDFTFGVGRCRSTQFKIKQGESR